MKKTALGFAVLVFALALTFAYWYADSDETPQTAGPAQELAQGIEPEAEAAELVAPTSQKPAAPASAPESRPAVAAPRIVDGARRDAGGIETLAGQLLLPANMPADETLSVEVYLTEPTGRYSLDLEREHESLHESAPVEPDGRFELSLPPDTSEFWTIARGRYVIETIEHTDLPLAAALILEPELGGYVTGRALPPRGTVIDPDEDAWRVRLNPDPLAVIGQDNPMALAVGGEPDIRPRRTEVDREMDFSFELRGVRPSEGYTLALVPESLAATKSERFDVAPGQHVALELPLSAGGTITGRVVDPEGNGIPEADIEAVQDPFMYGQGGFEVREARTDEAGHFVMAAVRAGQLTLKVEAEGYLDKNRNAELTEGQHLSEMEIVLDSGSTIAGWVRWPDGTPVADVEVNVGFDPSFLGGMEAFNAMRGANGEADTDEQGHFVVTGLGKGPFLVQVGAERETGGDEVEWRARLSAVRPDGEDLELVLEPPMGVAGRVIDDLGEPVTEFTVFARTKTSGMIAGLGAETTSEHFQDDGGQFFLEGLRTGEWEAFAGQPGYGQGQASELTLPLDETSELLLVLERAATVSGVVLDPGGTPVAGASVGRQKSLADLGRIGIEGGRPAAATTAEDGTFLLEGLSSGSQDLVAEHGEYAPSAAVGVELTPAQVIDDVVLTVRTGGRILGLIYDDEGEPWPGQTVMVQDPTMTTGQKWATSDGAGEFEVANLAPGGYQVMTFPRDTEIGGGEEVEGGDFASMFADMKFTMADVKDGEDTYVELGAKPANPVQLKGRVVAGGQPVPGTMVTLIADGEGSLESMKFTSTDGDGRFEMQLNRPGRYMINVQKMVGTGQQQSVEMLREVPEVEEHEVTLELPVGGISGKIRGPDGQPVKSARVSLAADGPIANGSFTGGNYAEIWTDAEGRYELHWLRAGTYSVAAGGAFLGGLFGDTGEITYGRQVQRVDVSEGQLLEGVDFELETPGKISGRVIDLSGVAVAEAAIFLRDENGNPIDRITMVSTDSNGRFEYASLEPGSYQVSARSQELVSGSSVTVRVREQEATEVELSLDRGTMLVVSLTDREGNHVRCRVQVTDSSGNQVNGMWSLADLMKVFSSGQFSTEQQRVGPLPPGKYKIEAIADDGRDARKTVTVSGQDERPIKLRLD